MRQTRYSTRSFLFYLTQVFKMGTKPRSSNELEELANIKMDINIPIRQYFRSADQVLKQAQIYKQEKDWERAYILHMKYTK